MTIYRLIVNQLRLPIISLKTSQRPPQPGYRGSYILVQGGGDKVKWSGGHVPKDSIQQAQDQGQGNSELTDV